MIRASLGLFAATFATVSALSGATVQPLDLERLPTGQILLHWPGLPGHTYFIQSADPADPLRTWFWSPLIEIGEGVEISHEVEGTAARGFFRLKYTDQIPADGETPESADYDKDGLSNWDEIAPPPPRLPTDPLNPDSDADGLPDGWEVAHGLDPNDPADAANIFPGSAITFLAAFQAGVQAIPGASPDNKDGDALGDLLDAAPNDRLIDWARPAADRFFAIQMPESFYSQTMDSGFACLELLDNFDVLASGQDVEGFWKLDPSAFVPVTRPGVTYTDPLWGVITRQANAALRPRRAAARYRSGRSSWRTK